MKIRRILLGLAFLASGTANAATIFAPTDGDVNFLLGDLLGAQLAIFDDQDQSYLGSSLGVSIGDVVGFAGPNGLGDHTATNTNTATAINLTDSSNFILGLSTDSGASWIPDASVVSLGANAYSVTFGTGANVIEVDVQIVPVPPAVWLFGSGLGLLGWLRRRQTA